MYEHVRECPAGGARSSAWGHRSTLDALPRPSGWSCWARAAGRSRRSATEPTRSCPHSALHLTSGEVLTSVCLPPQDGPRSQGEGRR